MAILAVDDSLSSLALIAQVASKLQRPIRPLSDPNDGLAFAGSNDLAMAIVDYDMPGMDGITLAKSIRSLPQHRDLPIVMITANEDATVRYRALEAGVADFLRKPFDEIELAVRLQNLLALHKSRQETKEHARNLEAAVKLATSTLVRREEEIILRLSRAAEFRDTDTGSHIFRMATYCRILAERLGLGEQRARMIFLGATMHDIGKMAIEDSILRKNGPLTAEERKQIELHTTIGHSILDGSDCELLQLGAEIALNHHERWDGKGYPNRLSGENIPLVARIAAVADVFDALTTARPYKRAWSPAEARAFIAEGTGRQFDPRCVSAFLAGWQDILDVYMQHHEQVQHSTPGPTVSQAAL